MNIQRRTIGKDQPGAVYASLPRMPLQGGVGARACRRAAITRCAGTCLAAAASRCRIPAGVIFQLRLKQQKTKPSSRQPGFRRVSAPAPGRGWCRSGKKLSGSGTMRLAHRRADASGGVTTASPMMIIHEIGRRWCRDSPASLPAPARDAGRKARRAACRGYGRPGRWRCRFPVSRIRSATSAVAHLPEIVKLVASRDEPGADGAVVAGAGGNADHLEAGAVMALEQLRPAGIPPHGRGNRPRHRPAGCGHGRRPRPSTKAPAVRGTASRITVRAQCAAAGHCRRHTRSRSRDRDPASPARTRGGSSRPIFAHARPVAFIKRGQRDPAEAPRDNRGRWTRIRVIAPPARRQSGP